MRGRVRELLKTVSIRVSQHFTQIKGLFPVFHNWSITQGHDLLFQNTLNAISQPFSVPPSVRQGQTCFNA
jgi:hypothetical protein